MRPGPQAPGSDPGPPQTSADSLIPASRMIAASIRWCSGISVP
jgi:hypothetical protein